MIQADNKIDVIIVGGGLAGLTAASFLADAGKRVVLYEKAQQLGGRAKTQEKDGYYFNLGPHALYRLGEGVKTLKELGIKFNGSIPVILGGLLIKNSNPYPLPLGLWTLMTTKLWSWPAKWEISRLMAALDKLDPVSLQSLSVQEWFEQEGYHTDTRSYLRALIRLTTYTDDPDRLSAGAAISQLQITTAGSVYYLDHGWQTLIDSLRQKAQASGVEIVTGAKVVAIDWDSEHGVRGVRLADGTQQAAEAVIVTTSPAAAQTLVGGITPLNRWAETTIPVKAAVLDVALRRLPRPQSIFALGLDQPLYFSVHSATAKLAPKGKALIHVAKYLNSTASESKLVEQELEGVLDIVQAGWRTVLVERRFLPNMIVSNAATTSAQGGLLGRPTPDVSGIPGLYVAGDWVGSVGMLADTSLASAKQAAILTQAYLADEWMFNELPATLDIVKRDVFGVATEQ